ncbi:Anthocyanin 5-aromatic acyltransferase [Quillaja saponaria]|uniref:Anthocyanin 5-aromatic acyltransferase n=1 Tax=Quillaja saponaria TaxID=32244 RepID=A0AAD7LEH2_QUISA|nr:Anthocyanin 5-aromatic acyltransferase [Quillaja saponaria]
MAHCDQFKVLANDQISPPHGSVPTTTIPLTFFDYLYVLGAGEDVIFYYEFPYPTHHFMETILPCLKQSLSLTLKHFFTFVSTLVIPPKPNKPYIRYVADSESSVPFTVVESTVDFNHIVADYQQDINKNLESFLVPKKTCRNFLEDENGTRYVFPLLAIQVTIMPNSGFCVVVNLHHLAADGTAFKHFMKSWSSVCKRLLNISPNSKVEDRNDYSSPIFNDGAMVQSPNEIELSFLNQVWKRAPEFFKMLNGSWSGSSEATLGNTANVKATFKLSQVQVDKLKHWISHKYYECSAATNNGSEEKASTVRLSTFIVTSSLIWVCWVKSEDNTKKEDEEHSYFFSADCRGRYEFVSIPSTYFGNFTAPVYVTLKRKQLIEENGIVEAAKIIGNKLNDLDKNGVMKEAEKWISNFADKIVSRSGILIAGSPKNNLNEIDFGVGRPKKCEFLGFYGGEGFSLFDCKDKNVGGLNLLWHLKGPK